MSNLNNKLDNESKLFQIRDAYITLVDYLRDIMFKKGILESSSYAELSRKIGYKYNLIKDRKDKLKKHYPVKKYFDELFSETSKRYKDILNECWNEITNKFSTFYEIAFKSEVRSIYNSKNSKKSIKQKFFEGIKVIIKSYFPGIKIFDTDISRILFIRARTLKDSHLKGSYKHRILTLSLLFSFIYRIRHLTKKELITKIRYIQNVDNNMLKKLKMDIETYIEKFIFSNPYDIKYINDTYDIGAIYFKPEYDLTLNVWMELSKAVKRPLLLKVARRILKYSTFGRINRFGTEGRGYVYSWDGLIDMSKCLAKLLPNESFSNLIVKIREYIKIRNLHPILPRIYHRSWYTKSTVKFHIIMLIIRDLGLEILNLEPIEPQAFKKTLLMEQITYERHHIFPNDKFSIDVNRLVLTMHKNHAKLERKTKVILSLIDSRIKLVLECPQYYKSRFVDWHKKWLEYLERRLYLIEFGIENFIRKYFTDKNGHNYIIERFFRDIPKGGIEKEIRNMIHQWIKKNRPVPILNTYILEKIKSRIPKLSISGFNII